MVRLFHVAAEAFGKQLKAVTNAQRRNAIKYLDIKVGRVGLGGRAGAAAQNDGGGLSVADGGFGLAPGDHFAVNAEFANTANDELGVLPPKIYDQRELMRHSGPFSVGDSWPRNQGTLACHAKAVDAESLRSAAMEFGLTLTEAQLAAFAKFEEALYAANAVKNLTRVPREAAWSRHFLDSLLVVQWISQGARVLDIGTGPGFPAWPLACARPDLQVVAMDSNGKMLGFLESQPLPNLKCRLVRAEEAGERERYDLVTGRAVAPLTTQLELSAAFAKVGGLIIPFRAESDLAVIESFDPKMLGLKLTQIQRIELPVFDAPKIFPIYEKVVRTPKEFPRRWAEMKNRPIA